MSFWYKFNWRWGDVVSVMHWYEHNAEVMVTDKRGRKLIPYDTHVYTPKTLKSLNSLKNKNILIMLPKQGPDTLQFSPSKHENQYILASQYLL